jgi:DNA-binding NarL/FixJ family response regulator
VHALLDAALEAIPRPAFVSTKSGVVHLANRLGRDALDRSKRAVREALAAACRGDASQLTAQRIRAPGMAPMWLVIGRAPPRAAAAITLMASRAKLSARQTEVLELLAQGYSNKGIAAELGCAPKTVEVHMTALLKRCKVGSRAELMAELLKLAST